MWGGGGCGVGGRKCLMADRLIGFSIMLILRTAVPPAVPASVVGEEWRREEKRREKERKEYTHG